MPTLIFRTPNGEVQQVEVQGDLTVGREAGNDVALRDNGVSRRHCRFWLDEQGAVWVEDLGSANGVQIDGVAIDGPARVEEGAAVTIGQVRAEVITRRPSALARRKSPTALAAPSGPARPAPSRPAPLAKRRTTRALAPSEVSAARAARPLVPAAVPASSRPMLTGATGPWANQTYELSGPRLVIGRVPPAQLVIEDDSVSRRHAELRRDGDVVSIHDLGSANGTFLNGTRVRESPLSNGDSLRFGVVEFVFSGPDGGRALRQQAKRRLRLVAAGVAGALVAVFAVVAVLVQPPQQPEGRLVPDLPVAQDPIKLLGTCKMYADPDNDAFDWGRAAETCAQVLDLDPTLAEARQIERQARKELGFEKLLAQAKAKISASQDDAALKLLVEIDPKSTAFRRARVEFKDAAERISKRSKTACKTDLKAGYQQTAFEACLRYMEINCNRPEGPESELQRLFERAAGQVGRKAEFKCPPEYAAFLGGVAVVGPLDDDPEKAVRAMYSDPTIAALMVRYMKAGRPKQIADELKRLRIRQKARYTNTLDDFVATLDLIDGRYASGQAGLMRNNPQETETFWKQALEADARLMPPNVRSYLAKDMGAQLAEAYYKIGMDQVQRSNYHEAFVAFYQGYQYNKANQEILVQLEGMQREALRSLSEPSCENAKFAADITIPDSLVFKKAEAMKQELGCR